MRGLGQAAGLAGANEHKEVGPARRCEDEILDRRADARA